MPYKPKFCCQCGEKIDIVDWKPWTSRRFCQLCATEFGIYDILRGVLLGIALLFGLYGIGSYFQKPEKPLNVATNQIAVTGKNNDSIQTKNIAQVSSNPGVQLPTQTGNSATTVKTQNTAAPIELKNKQMSPLAGESPEKIYFCGAQTKKGTMCSRRVKNGGRCWQHEGQAALLPQEKLIAVK